MTRRSFDPLPDGGYYMNIASHVRDGDGLITNICLLHEGCPHLPMQTGIYPLWPLLYGYVSRALPFEATGRWLATALYFATLLLAYAWASSLFPRRLFPRLLPGFDAGHVFVLMLGLNNEFFRYTSSPYTEGLAYTVVLLALLRFRKLLPAPSWRTGLEMGVWLAVASLARYQLFLLTLAAVPVLALAIALVRERRRAYAIMTAVCFPTYAAIMSVHYFRLKSFTPGMTVPLMYRWDQMRYSDAVSQIPIIRETHGLWSYLLDRAQSFPVGFGQGPQSYHAQFYTFQYALLAALPLLPVLGIRAAVRRGGAGRAAAEALAWLRRPTSLVYVYVTVFALGAFLSAHTLHMHTIASGEWIFAGRQAMVCGFLFLLSLVLLLGSAVFPWRLAGALILGSSIYQGGLAVRQHLKNVEGGREPATPEIASYLNGEKAARGGLVVVYRQPQLIARFTPGVNYHWYHPGTSLADVEAMVTKLGADLVVVPPGNGMAFARDARFRRDFSLVKTASGLGVYAPSAALLQQRGAGGG